MPCYQHLLGDVCDINFLWGGRYSGKSHFVAQRLIMDCLTKDYFRCILIKKTYESIKDAQWQMIKDIVNDWGLQDLFHFTESPLVITCANGNKFIARGCDKPEKMKSITNPSDAWYEEGNQLSEKDYITASTTLRNKEGKVREWFTFNPECNGDYENFWLWKNYFNGIPYNTNCTREKIIDVDGEQIPLTYSSTHTTFKDNPYVSQEQKARLYELNVTNIYYYQVYALGRWGKTEVQRPFAVNFNTEKHVSNEIKYNPHLPIYFSWDFNVEPFVVELAHIWTDGKGEHCHIFDEIVIEKNGSVPDMCDLIENKYGRNAMAMALFTGDAMQRKREITQKNNIDAWRIIDTRFQLGRRLGLPKANPRVAETRHLVNILLAFHPDLKVHPQCKKLIYDLQFCEVDENGEPLKKNRSDEKQRYDALDCFRYLCNSYLRGYLVKYNIRK